MHFQCGHKNATIFRSQFMPTNVWTQCTQSRPPTTGIVAPPRKEVHGSLSHSSPMLGITSLVAKRHREIGTQRRSQKADQKTGHKNAGHTVPTTVVGTASLSKKWTVFRPSKRGRKFQQLGSPRKSRTNTTVSKISGSTLANVHGMVQKTTRCWNRKEDKLRAQTLSCAIS